MEKRQLGQTDMHVSLICLGSMTWGQQNTEAEGHAQLDMAFEHGVNFVDTAEIYSVPVSKETQGNTESIIGNWLEKTGRRNDVIVATKVTGPGPDWLRGGAKLDRASILKACDDSLSRLKTDHIDLYQIHWPARPTNYFGRLRYTHTGDDNSISLEESLSAMKELYDAGKIRAVGLSNETPWGVHTSLMLAEKLGLPRVSSIQNPYNLLNRSFEVGLAEIAIKEQVGLLAYSPIAGGMLSGKYLGGARPKGARFTEFGSTFSRYLNPAAEVATEKYVALARKHGWDPAEFANTFVNMQPFVTANIIGATSLEQLKSALSTHDKVIPDEILAEINEIETEHPIPAP